MLLGPRSKIRAIVSAPHGTLAIDHHVEAAGAFAGFDVRLADHVHVDFQSGFPPSAPSGRQAVAGAVPVAWATAPLVGPVPANTILHLGLQLPIQNSAALAALARQFYDPTSPQSRQFLAPAQFAASFGASSTQYGHLVTFAQSHGLTVGATYGK